VVLTSSTAAVYTDAAECAEAPGGSLTEAVWNRTASLAYQPYSYSKTLAEQEAWKIAEGQAQWDLVVVNPSLVIGPATGQSPISESFDVVRQFGDCTMATGALRLALGVVDVRDLAKAHLAAAYTPSAKERTPHRFGRRHDDLRAGKNPGGEVRRRLSDPAPGDAEIPRLALRSDPERRHTPVHRPQCRPAFPERQFEEPSRAGSELSADSGIDGRDVPADDRARLFPQEKEVACCGCAGSPI
jgi:nucleoside-diphosphate-sugar epimerase